MQATFRDTEIESVIGRRRMTIVLTCAVLLFVVAGGAWFSYVAQGIAHGDLYGIPRREGDLNELAFGARVALLVALLCEGLAIGGIFRLLLAPVEPKWARLPACIILALFADFATLVVVRACA